MLFLLFQLGEDRYALDAAQVEEVLPLIAIKQIPLAPQGVAGAISYRCRPIPVIDLSEMTLGRPSARRMNTRIVVVHLADADGGPRLLGLIAEKVNNTIRRPGTDFVSSGVQNAEAPYLGPVATDASGLIQWVDADRLLSSAVRAVLYPQETLE